MNGCMDEWIDERVKIGWNDELADITLKCVCWS